MKYFLSKLPALFVYCLTFYVFFIPISIKHNFWAESASIACSLGFILTFLLSLKDYNNLKNS